MTINFPTYGNVMEQEYMTDLKSVGEIAMPVRVWSFPPHVPLAQSDRAVDS